MVKESQCGVVLMAIAVAVQWQCSDCEIECALTDTVFLLLLVPNFSCRSWLLVAAVLVLVPILHVHGPHLCCPLLIHRQYPQYQLTNQNQGSAYQAVADQMYQIERC